MAGETVGGARLEWHPGGKGANQALAAARAGARVSLVGRVGEDAFGAERLAQLQAEGIDVAHVRTSAAATGTAVVTLTPDGENTIVVAPGANGLVGPDDLDAAGSVMGEADVLVAQLEVPLAAVEHAIARCPATSVVVLNAAPARQLASELLRRVDVLVVNESEASALSGLTVIDAATAEGAARRLRTVGARAVVVTLGAAGALVDAPTGGGLVAAPRAAVVDTTGAGDAFVGALAARLALGAELVAAVGFANAVGAATTERIGASAVVPDGLAPRRASG